eukprot:CAMPEP_0176217898 /NCGR_PEP_ID=MMETSP0121_2-20121125/17927_1 /TAXON_ID=160619 /ORGANISM="Kryptoperidinium foliaceum, Strain CCMP 1326" /LENGTH=49 /DNA_ID=CAMNT_0017557037 /DNA_START=107 /DNA_END=256 /DNA_ORIENTATION=-
MCPAVGVGNPELNRFAEGSGCEKIRNRVRQKRSSALRRSSGTATWGVDQ